MSSSSRAVQRVHPPRAPFDLMNRTMRWLLASPRRARLAGDRVLVLHLTGRTSGRAIDVPVAWRPEPDGRLLVLTTGTWRVNLRGRPDVEVTRRGVRRPAVAELVEDPDAVADVYARLIAEVGRARAVRDLGVRVAVDREPTHAELADAARRDRLSVVRLSVADCAD